MGQSLGPEAELLDRYQVSRAVFREAVRILEHQQIARTRRGPGGGLVGLRAAVAASDRELARQRMRAHLHTVGALMR